MSRLTSPRVKPLGGNGCNSSITAAAPVAVNHYKPRQKERIDRDRAAFLLARNIVRAAINGATRLGVVIRMMEHRCNNGRARRLVHAARTDRWQGRLV